MESVEDSVEGGPLKKEEGERKTERENKYYYFYYYFSFHECYFHYSIVCEKRKVT